MPPNVIARPRKAGRAELSLFLSVYLVYNLARWLFVGDLDTAREHARSIVALEQSVGLAIERPVQDALDFAAATRLLSYIYLAAQFVVLPGALIWLYRRAPRDYRRLRATIVATWLIAIPIFALFPVAPPRLADMGFIDTVSQQPAVALTGRSTIFYNPLAAVPSLHVGFAVALGVALARRLRSRLGEGERRAVGSAGGARGRRHRQPLRPRHRRRADGDRARIRGGSAAVPGGTRPRSIAEHRMSDAVARLALVGVLAAGALLALSLVVGVVETPDVGGILADAADSLGAWTYLAIPTLAFLETGAFVGLVVPGETAIVVGGVVAERGEVELPLLIALVWAAAVGGDLVSFLLGRRFGRPFLDAHGPRLRIRASRSTASNGSSTATAPRSFSSGASSGSCAR